MLRGSPDEMGPDRCVWSGLLAGRQPLSRATRLFPGNRTALGLIQWNAFVRLSSPIRPAPKRGTVWPMSTSDEELETTWPEDPAAPAAGDPDGEDGGDTDGTDTDA